MRRITLALIIGMTLAATATYAHHLGPIVLGVERTEPVTICLRSDHLDEMIAAGARSIEKNESVTGYLKAVTPFMRKDSCSLAYISYTPLKILREWTGYEENGSGQTKVATFVTVEATTKKRDGTTITIYVLSSDPPTKA